MSDQPARAPAKRPARPAKKKPSAAVAKPNGAGEAQPVAVEENPPEPISAFFPVEVVDVVVTLPNPNPVLLLQTTDEPRRTVAIPIGIAEGTSIANALRNITTPKPLTHELFAETLELLDAAVAVARITAVEGGAFYAEIVVSNTAGQRTIACRPSDAVALALRQRPPAPIVTASSVLDAAGRGSGAQR
jgi:uncharacterized protein